MSQYEHPNLSRRRSRVHFNDEPLSPLDMGYESTYSTSVDPEYGSQLPVSRGHFPPAPDPAIFRVDPTDRLEDYPLYDERRYDHTRPHPFDPPSPLSRIASGNPFAHNVIPTPDQTGERRGSGESDDTLVRGSDDQDEHDLDLGYERNDSLSEDYRDPYDLDDDDREYPDTHGILDIDDLYIPVPEDQDIEHSEEEHDENAKFIQAEDNKQVDWDVEDCGASSRNHPLVDKKYGIMRRLARTNHGRESDAYDAKRGEVDEKAPKRQPRLQSVIAGMLRLTGWRTDRAGSDYDDDEATLASPDKRQSGLKRLNSNRSVDQGKFEPDDTLVAFANAKYIGNEVDRERYRLLVESAQNAGPPPGQTEKEIERARKKKEAYIKRRKEARAMAIKFNVVCEFVLIELICVETLNICVV